MSGMAGPTDPYLAGLRLANMAAALIVAAAFSLGCSDAPKLTTLVRRTYTTD